MKHLFLFLILFAGAHAIGQQVFEEPDVQPEFPGGQAAMNKFITSNIQYPAAAKDKGIEGTVVVQFVVEEDGRLTNVEVRKKIGGGCDEEAVRVIQKMPKWKAGIKAGKKIRCRYTVPISFKLV